MYGRLVVSWRLGRTRSFSSADSTLFSNYAATCGQAEKAEIGKKKKKKKKNKYTDTILLPQTRFPVHVAGKDRAELDERLNKSRGFAELYGWQRENLPGPEFVLHDGPPYANGVPHMGHAINKILKDITLRNKVISGRRVHYVPGWDCHGLPIELKAVSSESDLRPMEIRRKAREYAKEAIDKQRQAFASWGVMADWSENGCYFTNTAAYVKNELRQFLTLYERGLVYRDFKPVYWSPSSKTALAESELEYNESHRSKCALVRLRVSDLPARLKSFAERHVYALTWTTTPWTLVANQALSFAADATYCLARDNEGNLNVVAEPLLESVASKIGPLSTVATFGGNELAAARYLHPFSGESLPFLRARHVTTSMGTGLVHTAPAHGPEDFLVALENDLKVLSVVDVDGRYTEEAGQEFSGLNIFTEGNDRVLERMAGDVLHVETLTHSYPYDWRTKKPVVIRASDQWFVDINSIKERAIESIARIKIYPPSNRTAFVNALLAQVQQRPYWCISRQRSWGTPIPVLRNATTGQVSTSRKMVETLCRSIDRYGPDCWWSIPAKELLGIDVISELNIDPDQAEKGKDILDIWFDSGISWSSVLPGGRADLYLEGQDQITGWFQSSLLTSIALRGFPPYRALFVHGFAVDGDSSKMSKSLGNVVNPDDILKGGGHGSKQAPPYGIDVLRWWVASHGCQHSQVPVTKELLDGCSQLIQRLRLVLRFLLGMLHPYQSGVEVEPRYRLLDKYMLHSLYEYNAEMRNHYENYEYHHACKTIVNFVANQVSGMYCHAIKDRVYCDEAESANRVAAVRVARHVLTVLTRSIAPILPHLAEEVWMHYPENFESAAPLYQTSYEIPQSWKDPTIAKRLDAAFRLKKELNKMCAANARSRCAIVNATKNDFADLSVLHDEKKPTSSELCEILQLSSITLVENDGTTGETRIALTELKGKPCERCKVYPEISESGLCGRCTDVLVGRDGIVVERDSM